MSNGKGSTRRRRQVPKETYDKNHTRTFGESDRSSGKKTYVWVGGKMVEKAGDPQWIMAIDPAAGPDSTYVARMDWLKKKMIDSFMLREGDHDNSVPRTKRVRPRLALPAPVR